MPAWQAVAAQGVAWLAYVPIPGVALLVAITAPNNRLVRFHARQATVIVLFAYVMLILFGLLAKVMPAAEATVTPAAGVVVAILLIAVMVGGIGAARGRYNRVRPFWDLVAR